MKGDNKRKGTKGNVNAVNVNAGNANPSTGTAEKAGQPILGNTEVLRAFFQELYAAKGWKDLKAAPAYRSGPVPKSQGGLAMRRTADPMARFYFAVTMAEAALLVYCVAHNTAERDQLNREIDGVLGLSAAVASGRIGGFMICWTNGRYPRTATTIRIFKAPGQRTRSQVLGTLDKEIRRFVDAIMAPPYKTVRIVNGRPSGQG